MPNPSDETQIEGHEVLVDSDRIRRHHITVIRDNGPTTKANWLWKVGSASQHSHKEDYADLANCGGLASSHDHTSLDFYKG
jgi:hypothetical protein